MTMAGQHSGEERARAAVSAALVQTLIGCALIWGLGAPLPRAIESPLRLFAVAPPPPPPVSRPPPLRRERAAARKHDPGREGAASPPNIRSQPTEIVAPPPRISLPLPPPIVAAPVAGSGSDPSAGAASVRGPGNGAGGLGDGRGSGTGGDGEGGGFGPESPPRLIRGSLGNSDYPAWAGEAGAGGMVSVRFTVALDGRAVNCRITRSSGHAELDAHTCGLIERRYRFEPSRDGRGRPVLADMVEDHEWVVRDEPRGRRRF